MRHGVKMNSQLLVEEYVEGKVARPVPRRSLTFESLPVISEASLDLYESAETEVDRSLPSPREIARKVRDASMEAIESAREFAKKFFAAFFETMKKGGKLLIDHFPKLSIRYSPPVTLVIRAEMPRAAGKFNYALVVDLSINLLKGTVDVAIKGRIGDKLDFNITTFRVYDHAEAKAEKQGKDAAKAVERKEVRIGPSRQLPDEGGDSDEVVFGF